MNGDTISTIGELSRSTNTTLQSTVTASGGTISLAKLSTLFDAVASGTQKPTLGITTETVWNLIESLIEPAMRQVREVSAVRSGIVGGAGLTGIVYRGVEIVADEKCTSGVFFWLNEDYVHWYGLPLALTEPINFKASIKGNDYSSVVGLGFSASPWIPPINAPSVVKHLYLGGNLVTDNPKRHGKLTGVTSV